MADSNVLKLTSCFLDGIRFKDILTWANEELEKRGPKLPIGTLTIERTFSHSVGEFVYWDVDHIGSPALDRKLLTRAKLVLNITLNHNPQSLTTYNVYIVTSYPILNCYD